MDSLESNKLYAAILTAGILFSVAGIIGGIAVHPQRLEKTVLKIQGVAETGSTPEAPKPLAPIGALLAKADPAAGDADTKKYCVSCHNFAEGAGAKIGPDLYGILGRPVGSAAGFDYSSAIKKHSGPWTFAELNEWLYSPRSYAPGTKMSFAGIENDKARGDVIAYLRTLSANPEPLPPVEAAPAAAPVATPAAAKSAATNAGAGQQLNQPSANQNQPQTQQSESEQPPQAHAVGASDAPGGAQGKPTTVPSPTTDARTTPNATTLQH